CVHQVGELGAGQPGLDLIGIDDGILDTYKHLDGFLHLGGIAHRYGHVVVDHHHGHRADQHTGPSHSDHACSGFRDAVNLDRDIVRIVHQHVIDLGCRYAIPAGTVDPDRDVSASTHQFFLKKLGRDVIVKPAFLDDGAV